MKLVAFILLSVCTSVHAIGYAQKITLVLKNAPLVKAFESIKQQSGYRFFYNEEQLRKSKPISIQVKDVSLDEVLHICFKDQPFTYDIVNNLIVIKERSGENGVSEMKFQSQLIDVKGRVLNEKGEPVEGVTVAIKGTAMATSTDINGEFVLSSIDRDAILVFTSINMEPFELKVSGRQELSVILKAKVTSLGNVVITVSTGYQEVPKERATGSFTKIDNNTLNQQVGGNILKRLDGVASGVLFDTKQNQGQKRLNVMVRGLSSINGPLDPLIVLDGFIYEGDINNINPNIVEEISILKDAAAASIWGARAGNGVIVITTKHGGFNQKFQLEIGGNVIVNSKPDLFYLPQMSSADYIDVEEFLYNKGYFNGQFTDAFHPSLTPAVEVFRQRALGQISSNDSAIQINALKNLDIRNGFKKHFYTNSVLQQYSAVIRGGSNNNAYTIAVGYDNNKGESYNTFNKLNIKVENTFKPIANLLATVSMYFTKSISNSGRPTYNSILVNGRQAPYLNFEDRNGNAMPIDISLRGLYTDTAGSGKLMNWKYYPLLDYLHDKTKTDIQELFTNVGIQYRFLKHFSVDLKYQYQKQQSESVRLQDEESYGARNIVNTFSQLNRSTGVVKYIVPIGGIRTGNTINIESQTLRGQLNFSRSWGMHEITAIMGGEIREAHSWSNRSVVYGFKESPLSFGVVDLVNSYPSFVTGYNQKISGSPFYSNTINRFVSTYANIANTLKKKYIISFSARRDGSNLFGAETNDKWKPLWSWGLGWNLSNENFYRFELVPLLRLRATCGYSGNVDLTKTSLPIETYIGANSFTGFPNAFINQLNNPELKWEKVRMLNFGIDFSLKNKILSGTIEYYSKKGINLYGTTFYDYTAFGLTSSISGNTAGMEGKGVEVLLNSTILNRKLVWNTSLIFNYNTSKTSEYHTKDAEDVSRLLGGGNSITPIVGKPLYAIAAYKWGGLDASGNPQGYVNGQKSTDYNAIISEGRTKGANGNIVFLGSALPEYYGSIINAITWKNVSFSANISYKFRYYFQKSAISYSRLVSNGIGHKEFAERWRKAGDEAMTNVPSFIYPTNGNRDSYYQYSEVNVLKGDHIRLQYINLGYTLANNSSNKLPFRNIGIYLNLANVGILWRANNLGIDPEYPAVVPPTRSFSIGLKANM